MGLLLLVDTGRAGLTVVADTLLLFGFIIFLSDTLAVAVGPIVPLPLGFAGNLVALWTL